MSLISDPEQLVSEVNAKLYPTGDPAAIRGGGWRVDEPGVAVLTSVGTVEVMAPRSTTSGLTR